MQDLPLGKAAAQLATLVAHYPWQAFAVVPGIVLLAMTLLNGDRSRGSGGDPSLFGGDTDGCDGGGCDGGGGD
jgi:hypothetical protein